MWVNEWSRRIVEALGTPPVRRRLIRELVIAHTIAEVVIPLQSAYVFPYEAESTPPPASQLLFQLNPVVSGVSLRFCEEVGLGWWVVASPKPSQKLAGFDLEPVHVHDRFLAVDF